MCWPNSFTWNLQYVFKNQFHNGFGCSQGIDFLESMHVPDFIDPVFKTSPKLGPVKKFGLSIFLYCSLFRAFNQAKSGHSWTRVFQICTSKFICHRPNTTVDTPRKLWNIVNFLLFNLNFLYTSRFFDLLALGSWYLWEELFQKVKFRALYEVLIVTFKTVNQET